jgi:protein ImuB
VARVSDAGTRAEDPRHTITALRVFRPPLPAQVVLRDGRPVRLECEQVRGDIAWSAGPWRLSGAWWTEQAWAREEWDVCVGEALYRIYRDASGWFAEGTYD